VESSREIPCSFAIDCELVPEVNPPEVDPHRVVLHEAVACEVVPYKAVPTSILVMARKTCPIHGGVQCLSAVRCETSSGSLYTILG
jgi:hypothetical protein